MSDTVIVTILLPADVHERLMRGASGSGKGIGEILVDSALEKYKAKDDTGKARKNDAEPTGSEKQVAEARAKAS